MAQCHACGAEVGGEQGTCPSCGARLSEPTASFEPIAVDVSTDVVPGAQGESSALIVRKGPQPGERFFIDRERLTIGRDPDSDIFLNDLTVSRQHAVLEAKGGKVSVKDAGSLNGTYVNGEIAESSELSEGDVVQIGTFQMVFVGGTGGY